MRLGAVRASASRPRRTLSTLRPAMSAPRLVRPVQHLRGLAPPARRRGERSRSRARQRGQSVSWGVGRLLGSYPGTGRPRAAACLRVRPPRRLAGQPESPRGIDHGRGAAWIEAEVDRPHQPGLLARKVGPGSLGLLGPGRDEQEPGPRAEVVGVRVAVGLEQVEARRKSASSRAVIARPRHRRAPRPAGGSVRAPCLYFETNSPYLGLATRQRVAGAEQQGRIAPTWNPTTGRRRMPPRPA